MPVPSPLTRRYRHVLCAKIHLLSGTASPLRRQTTHTHKLSLPPPPGNLPPTTSPVLDLQPLTSLTAKPHSQALTAPPLLLARVNRRGENEISTLGHFSCKPKNPFHSRDFHPFPFLAARARAQLSNPATFTHSPTNFLAFQFPLSHPGPPQQPSSPSSPCHHRSTSPKAPPSRLVLTNFVHTSTRLPRTQLGQLTRLPSPPPLQQPSRQRAPTS